MSIRELSRQTGVTYTTIWAIYHMQRRSVQFGILESICRVLDVQPGDIYVCNATDINSKFHEKVEKPRSPEAASRKSREAVLSSIPDQHSDDWRNW